MEQKQTEPIGFKGTPGEWITDYSDDIVAEENDDLKDGGDIICCPPLEFEASMRRWEYNKQIIVASKNMAIALQEIADCDNRLNIYTDRQLLDFVKQTAKEALKQAGL